MKGATLATTTTTPTESSSLTERRTSRCCGSLAGRVLLELGDGGGHLFSRLPDRRHVLVVDAAGRETAAVAAAMTGSARSNNNNNTTSSSKSSSHLTEVIPGSDSGEAPPARLLLGDNARRLKWAPRGENGRRGGGGVVVGRNCAVGRRRRPSCHHYHRLDPVAASGVGNGLVENTDDGCLFPPVPLRPSRRPAPHPAGPAAAAAAAGRCDPVGPPLPSSSPHHRPGPGHHPRRRLTPFTLHVLLLLLGGGGMMTAGSAASSSSSRLVDLSPQLTPWWALVMATGESVSLDCGVYVGSETAAGAAGGGVGGDLVVLWMDPSGANITDISHGERFTSSLRERNHVNDTTPGAYRVLTLSIHHLQEKDSGDYTCQASRTINGVSNTTRRTISLQVLNNSDVCTFESSDLCGWRDLAATDDVPSLSSSSSSLAWRYHDGADAQLMDRRKGRYDHTYGASKHSGHFLDIDMARDSPPDGAVARLQSPPQAPHSGARCLHFWYIYDKGLDNLKVTISPANSSSSMQDNTALLLNNTSAHSVKEWTLGTADIRPKSYDYHVTFTAKPRGRRKSGFIALDDFRFFDGSCDNVSYVWPERNLPVRLVNGSSEFEGRVEILHDGMWGSVCSTSFGNNEAKVICNGLGYKGDGAVARRRSEHGAADDNVIIWLEELGCSGSERDLGACIAVGETWGSTETCDHNDSDASVICGEVAPTPAPTLPLSMDTSSAPPASVSSLTLPTTPGGSITQTTPKPPGGRTTVSPAPPTVGGNTVVPQEAETTSDERQSTTLRPAPMMPSTGAHANLTALPTAGSGRTTPRSPLAVVTVNVPVSGGDVAGKGGGSTEVNTVAAESSETDNSSSINATESTWTHEPVQSARKRGGTGAAVGVSLLVLLVVGAIAAWLYRRRRNRRKSKYIVFSNPKYSREHLPANDISLDSPLTSGSSILA